MTYLYIVLGGTMVLLGLNVWQSLAVVLAGNVFWLLVGWLSVSGPSSGTPSEVVTRAMYGIRGNRAYNALVGWAVGVAYEAINLSVGALAGFALVEHWGGSPSAAVKWAIVLGTALFTFTISVYGHATIVRFSGWFTWILLAGILVLGFYVLRHAHWNYQTRTSTRCTARRCGRSPPPVSPSSRPRRCPGASARTTPATSRPAPPGAPSWAGPRWAGSCPRYCWPAWGCWPARWRT